jgi:N-acetylneuraminate synthase
MNPGDFGILDRRIGPGAPTYVIAELSANHNHKLEAAMALIDVAADAGADAVKLQTYKPDTITIDCKNEHFQIKQGTLWDGRALYDLYAEAMTPWEWHAPLMAHARARGLHCFSSPFDATAVDFLETLQVPAYKVASFELVDLPLLRKIASTGKPVILSTGMATLDEIAEALAVLEAAGPVPVALLRTNSGYPASPAEMDLRGMQGLRERFGRVVGLSDHTLGTTIAVAAVAMGACIVEKHITLSRAEPGPDSAFSLEPDELRALVQAIRTTEAALGTERFGPTARERSSLPFRRSLFVVADVRAGEPFTADNVRSIRPGSGLHTRYLEVVLGRVASRDVTRGTPLAWDLVEGGEPRDAPGRAAR